MNVIATELAKRYPSVAPVDFYREIFPVGELDKIGAFTPGKYMGVAVEIFSKPAGGRPTVHRYSVGDDLAVVEQLQQSEQFCILAPISYAGKTRDSKMARNMYALVVELDSLIVRNGRQQGLHALINLWSGDHPYLPCPTFLVASGTGVHLYYQFIQPIPLFKNVVEGLADYKRALTRMIWNNKTTTDYEEDKIQFESVFQGFRMVGTRTKAGDKVEAFRCGKPVSIAHMNSFTAKVALYKSCLIPEVYKSSLTLAQAKEKYPEWYQERIVEKRPKGKWDYSQQKGHRGDEMYMWWINRIRNEAAVGHRYYCLMMLSIYAIKCDIDEDRLLLDMYELLPIFDERTTDEANHFTLDDLMDALQAYNDKDLYTYPVASIQNRSGLVIPRNKRNGRKQAEHLEYMRFMRGFKHKYGESSLGGRPTKEQAVVDYIAAHPWETKSAVAKELGISRPTVAKYWAAGEQAAFAEAEELLNMVHSRRMMCEDYGIDHDEETGALMDDDYWHEQALRAFDDPRLYDWYLHDA